MAKPALKKKDDHKRCREYVSAITEYYERTIKEKVRTSRHQAILWAAHAQTLEEKLEEYRSKHNAMAAEGKKAVRALNSQVTRQANAAKAAARKLEIEKQKKKEQKEGRETDRTIWGVAKGELRAEKVELQRKNKELKASNTRLERQITARGASPAARGP